MALERFADRTFALLDSDGDGVVGPEAGQLLARAQLPPHTLQEIWNLASGGEATDALTKPQWEAACRLVAQAQTRGEVTVAGLHETPETTPDLGLNPAPDTQPTAVGGSRPVEGGLSISVTSPETVGSGVTRFTRYTVVTEAGALDAFPRARACVQRRFRDFEWLHSRLRQRFRGTVLPPPPRKQWKGNMDAGFVEARRADLEAYVNAVAAHPKLRGAAELVAVLDASDEGLEAARELMPLDTTVHGPVVPASSVTEAAASTVSSGVKSLWGSVKSAVGMTEAPPPPELDTRFDDEVEAVAGRVDALSATLARALAAAEDMVATERAQHYELARMAHHMAQLGQLEGTSASDGFEAEDDQLIEAFGEVADSVSDLQQDAVDGVERGFVGSVRLLHGRAGAVADVLRMRERALQEVTAAHGSLFRNKKRYQAARASGEAAKATEAAAKMDAAEARVAVGAEQALFIGQNLAAEVAEHNRGQAEVYGAALHGLVRERRDHAARVGLAWQSLLQRLQPSDEEMEASRARVAQPVVVPPREQPAGVSGKVGQFLGGLTGS